MTPRAGHTAQTNIENSYFDPKLRIYAFQMKKYKNLFCSSLDLVQLRPRLFPSTNVSSRKSSYSMGNFFLIGTGVLDHPTYKTGNSTLHPSESVITSKPGNQQEAIKNQIH